MAYLFMFYLYNICLTCLCFIYMCYVLFIHVVFVCFTMFIHVLFICFMSCLSMLYLYVSWWRLFMSNLYVLFITCLFSSTTSSTKDQAIIFRNWLGIVEVNELMYFPWHLYLTYHYPLSSPCSFITWYLSLSGKSI